MNPRKILVRALCIAIVLVSVCSTMSQALAYNNGTTVQGSGVIFTSKRWYKPFEPVYVSGYNFRSGAPFRMVIIHEGLGLPVYRRDLYMNSYGSFSVSFKLPYTGNYGITVQSLDRIGGRPTATFLCYVKVSVWVW